MFFFLVSPTPSPTPATTGSICAALDLLALRNFQMAETRSNLLTNSASASSSLASPSNNSSDSAYSTDSMSSTPSPREPGTVRDQDSSSRLSKERRRRVRHHKSRKGCFTCKQRRVKVSNSHLRQFMNGCTNNSAQCDEVQPICGACAFRGESCSYPVSAPSKYAYIRLLS